MNDSAVTLLAGLPYIQPQAVSDDVRVFAHVCVRATEGGHPGAGVALESSRNSGKLTMPKGITALLVEDNPAHAKMVAIALKDSKYPTRLHHVTDGDEALDFIYGRGQFNDRLGMPQIDVIFLDLRLGRVDGLEVLCALKADPSTRSIPVVVLTTSDRQEDINRAYSCGANAFVTKPLEFSEFTRKVRGLAEFWAATAEIPACA